MIKESLCLAKAFVDTQNGKQSVGYLIWLPWLQTAKETVVAIGSMCVMGKFLQFDRDLGLYRFIV